MIPLESLHFNSKIYATNNFQKSNGDPATVKVIEPINNTIIATINVGINPNYIAIDPLSGNAYVTNFTSNSVSVINTTTNSVIATIPFPNPPMSAIVVDKSVYVCTYVNDPNGTVEVIEIPTNSIVSTIPIGRDAVSISAVDDYVFVVNRASREISVIDVIPMPL